MKYILLIFVFLTLSVHAKDNIEVTKDFDKQMESFYPLVELSMEQRENSGPFFDFLEDEIDTSGHLCASSVHKIKKATDTQNYLRKELLSRALMYEPWIHDKSIEPQLRLRGVMFSLASAIILYDNYLLNIAMFQNQKHLRDIINSEDSEYGIQSRELLFAAKEYSSISNYIHMKKAIDFYNNSLKKGIELDEQMSDLQELIENSPSYRALIDKNLFQIVGQRLSFYGHTSVDEVTLVEKNSVNLISEVFGNGIGLVATRKGHMYNKPELEKNIYNTLKAGDILLEKTPFRLTDKFIPGFWGHAAIWVGTKEELQELGLWDNPVVKAHHEELEQGKLIVEAVRSGVILSSMEHFLNIDDMAILREKQDDTEKRKSIILRAFAQLGKDYDFNFDVETTDKIVCSELVYICYTHIQWPTSKALGRYTVSPDHIAQKTQSGELELVSLYYQGKEIQSIKMLWAKMLKDEL